MDEVAVKVSNLRACDDKQRLGESQVSDLTVRAEWVQPPVMYRRLQDSRLGTSPDQATTPQGLNANIFSRGEAVLTSSKTRRFCS